MTLEKPTFNKDQINSATDASKKFGEIRKKAKIVPQFISENNKIDSVVLDYNVYEEMYSELQSLRELTWELEIAHRLNKADSTNVRYSLQEVFGEDEFEEFKSIDPDSIPDEALFE